MAGIWFDHARYDGFGNLTAKTGTGGAPSFSATIDAATNRWAGVSHDANGNQLYAPMMAGMPNAFTLGYDVSNRMTLAWNGGKKNEYEYDPGNKRVTEVNYTANGSGDWVKDGEVLHFFGITGQRLATYSVGVMNEGYSTAAVILTQSASWVWFGGKLANGNQDRLGSVGKYLPYGEEKPGATGNPANGTVKFATYVRDAVTGIDYADQRWHAPGVGRFLTADPYQASAGPGDPGSWNRYGYVQGDPIGYADSSGLIRNDCAYNKAGCQPGDWDDGVPLGGGGIASGCPVVWMGNGFAPNLAYCYVPPLAFEPPQKPLPNPPCTSGFAAHVVSFVESHYGEASQLGDMSNLDPALILSWSAWESGWGRTVRGKGTNFFGWRGRGDLQPCPGAYGCFVQGYLGSGTAALFGSNFFSYGGSVGVPAASILADQFLQGASTAQAFQALANAGYDPGNRQYGERVASVVGLVQRVIDCLQELGRL